MGDLLLETDALRRERQTDLWFGVASERRTQRDVRGSRDLRLILDGDRLVCSQDDVGRGGSRRTRHTGVDLSSPDKEDVESVRHGVWNESAAATMRLQ